MFPPTLLSRLAAIDEGLPLKYAKRFWKGVEEACLEAWNGHPFTREETDAVTGETRTVKRQYRIKDLVGVASLAKLGKDVMTSDLESREPGKLEELTNKLVEVDWEKREDNPWMRSQAGFAGQKDLYEMLHALVYNDKRPGEPVYKDLAQERPGPTLRPPDKEELRLASRIAERREISIEEALEILRKPATKEPAQEQTHQG